MKFTIGILVGIIVGAMVIIGVLSYMLVSGFFSSDQPAAAVNSPVPSTASIRPSTTAASLPSSSRTNTPAVASPSTSSSSTPSLTGKPSPSSTPATDASGVTFEMFISNYDYSAARPNTGTVYASITNKGSTDAHNTQVKMELSCGGSIVKVSYDDLKNQASYRKNLGTIKAGDTVTDQATITVGLLDGVKIAANGATIVLTITSDEKTDTLNYEILPVLQN
jgi:cytoskeletal protein RodZ